MVMDGAMGTMLIQKGGDCSWDPLWAAKVLVEKPDLIYQIHKEYYEAGADIGLTNSYKLSW